MTIRLFNKRPRALQPNAGGCWPASPSTNSNLADPSASPDNQSETVRGLALLGSRTGHFPLQVNLPQAAVLPGRLSISTTSRLGFFNCPGTRCRFTSPYFAHMQR